MVFGALLTSSEGETTFKKASLKRTANQGAAREEPSPQDMRYANALDSLGVKLHPGTKHRKDSKPTPRSEARCKALVYRTLQTLPNEHTEYLTDLTLFFTKDGRRGLAGGKQIILRCLNVADDELASVLTHEIGHLADENILVGEKESGKSGFYDFGTPIYENDPSLLFYRLSWENDRKKREEASSFDFVSGYSASDPFEDFAETYLMYRFHGPEFRNLIAGSEILSKKYEFMKEYVFLGEEFETTTTSNYPMYRRVYDTTTLPFDIEERLKVAKVAPTSSWH